MCARGQHKGAKPAGIVPDVATTIRRNTAIAYCALRALFIQERSYTASVTVETCHLTGKIVAWQGLLSYKTSANRFLLREQYNE
jgi:hypothetical protein